MKVTCTKPEAAARQLDEAISLLFSGHDPLAVHTLASAARGIFADLFEHSHPGKSSRTQLIVEVMETHGLTRKKALEIFHWVSNYLKHADRDSDAVLSFDVEAIDHLIFGCILDCIQLKHPLSSHMTAFLMWYSACHPKMLGEDTEMVRAVCLSFPDMHKKTREEKLAWGMEIERNLSR